MIAISLTAVTATTVQIGYAGYGAATSFDTQISPRRDFQFCVAPIINSAVGASITWGDLNQRCTYYARARSRYADGSVDPDWSPAIGFRTSDAAARSTGPVAVLISPAVVVMPEPIMFATATGTIAGFPETNVGIDAPIAWKGVSAGDHNFDMQLAGQPVDTIAVLNSNIPEAGMVSIYSSPTQAGLASGVGRVQLVNAAAFRASPNLPGRNGYHGLFQFAATVLPWIRIVFIGTKTGGVLSVEHIICGRNRASKNHSVDKTETPIPKTDISRSRSGIPDRVDGIPMRKVEFEIAMMTEEQYETIYGDLIYLENEAALVVPNSRTGAFLHDRILFGDMKGSRIFNPSSPRYTRGFAIESLI